MPKFMSDTPFETLLNPVQAVQAIQHNAPRVPELLRGRVNFATKVFQKCQKASTGAEDEDLPLLLLYLHIIEMTDGIEVLLSNSTVNPAKLLLRTCYEASLGIEYLLETNYQKRAACFMVYYAHSRLEVYEKLDLNTIVGQNLQAWMASDQFMQSLNLTPELQQDVQLGIQNWNSYLLKPQYTLIEQEYQRLKLGGNKYPHWYNLFSNLSSVAKLARHLNRYAEYEFLYGNSSAITHAVDMKRFIAKDANGNAAFYALRNSTEINLVALCAARYIHDATEKLLQKFRVSESSIL